MTHAGHTIASGLLTAYLGADAGRRVHAGAVERGTVESIRAVLWYADIRTFTAIADTTPGAVVIELLDEIFETLTASLRPRGGEVLKFLGDGMLAIFPFEDATREHVCHRALEAAAEAMRAINRLNARAGRAAPAKHIAAQRFAQYLDARGFVDRRPDHREIAARRDAGKPAAAVDLALHLGEVLYGNVGAVDRLADAR